MSSYVTAVVTTRWYDDLIGNYIFGLIPHAVTNFDMTGRTDNGRERHWFDGGVSTTRTLQTLNGRNFKELVLTYETQHCT